MKRYILWPSEFCEVCGGNPYVYTSAPQGHIGANAYDGDNVVCDCGYQGVISADGESDTTVIWDYEMEADG